MEDGFLGLCVCRRNGFHTHDAEWDKYAYKFAKGYKETETMEWLEDNGYLFTTSKQVREQYRLMSKVVDNESLKDKFGYTLHSGDSD